MNKADSSLGFFRKIQSDKVCVFISHKKEDQDIAIELGKYLTEQLDVDIYLDLFDSELREAVSVENDAKIVASVINGLKLSQVLLCIITDKTRLSWWVPYEIGMADNAGVKIATVYKGNIIKNLIMDCQSYTKYRPNETTGGIFVSWRRKEELPTGA